MGLALVQLRRDCGKCPAMAAALGRDARGSTGLEH